MHAAGRRTLPPVPRPSAERVDATADVATDVAAGPVATLTLERPATPPEATPTDASSPALPEEVADPDLDETSRFVLVEDLPVAEDPDADEAVVESTVAQDDAPTGNDTDDGDEDKKAEPHADVEADDEEADDEDAEAHAEEAEDAEEAEAHAAVDADADEESFPDPLDVDEDDPAQQFVARLRSAAVDFADAAGAENAVVREAVPPARHRRARCRVVLRYADGTDADLTFLGPVERAGRAARRTFDADIARWLGSDRRQDPAWLVEDEDAQGGFAVDVSAWAITG